MTEKNTPDPARVARWEVRVQGPDDLLPAASRLDAMRQSHSINAEAVAFIEGAGDDPIIPLVWASPVNADARAVADEERAALVAEVERLPDCTCSPVSGPQFDCPLHGADAVLAEAAPALPTSQTTEGGCSDAPAEQRAEGGDVRRETFAEVSRAMNRIADTWERDGSDPCRVRVTREYAIAYRLYAEGLGDPTGSRKETNR